MTALPSFEAFFKELWPDYKSGPFPWQTILAERIAEGRWPRALDLPTAAGKTACIDAAIYALAFQANKPIAERTAPRRIWFVVDRRIVVDEAFERASIIAEKLESTKDGPLKAVADRLLGLSGTKRPLAVARLRGGILRDDNWGRLPTQPAVITSTIDQLGSRLLFRGYGRSHLTASIYAGLAAHDSLILLDEAHLSTPFLQTLSAIERFRSADWARTPITTPFSFAFLSATLPDIQPDEVFPRREERERALDHPALHARMSASKPTELMTVNREQEEDPLVEQATRRAHFYLRKAGKRRVAVIVNRVGTARAIYTKLQEQGDGEAAVVLLTGRIRPYERDRLVEEWKPFLKAANPTWCDKPIILVSTQCIEVGADFSFDALVTEAASLDALRQRFGRLNRMGTPGAAPATILIRDKDANVGLSDPVYGAAMAECWRLLNEKATSAGKKREASIDFGISALDSTLSGIDPDDLRRCMAPRGKAPILLPAHLDLLSQTAPSPAVEPDIRLFLHGKEKGVPEARVVWRSDFSTKNRQAWKEMAALCPPLSGEMLTVPLHRLRDWLAEEASVDVETSDVEGASIASDIVDEDGVKPGSKAMKPVLLWRGRDRSGVVNVVSAIKPNDVIVIPAAYGMLQAGQAAPSDALGVDGLDLWEPVQSKSGRPLAMRINRASLEPWLGFLPLRELVDIAEDPATAREDLRSAIVMVLQSSPVADEAMASPPQWLLDLLDSVRDGRIEEHPGGGCVLFAKGSSIVGAAEPDLFADEDDLWSAVGEEVTLARHSLSVERAVEKIANRCLPGEFLDPLRRAAYWHDVGKLDERFQLVLRQGDELANGFGPLAKSAFVPTSPGRRNAIRAAAGLPEGFRHEMLSLQLAERYAALPNSSQAAELVLHLVASHHGHARPFAPVIPDPDAPPVFGTHDGIAIELSTAERAALAAPHGLHSGIPDRFWQLTQQYGWWGLAYLEAILRLADWYGSEYAVDEDSPRKSAPSRSDTGRASITATTSAEAPLVLAALDGANPLGFLAALGTLVVLREGACLRARLGWKRGATWQPVLIGVSTMSKDELCNTLATAVVGRSIPHDAEEERLRGQRDFDLAKRALTKKRDEIRQRHLRGKERTEAIENEIAPLEEVSRSKRSAWLKALKRAIPSPELALGKHIDCTSDEYRQYATGFLDESTVGERMPLDLLAAFASDACLDRSGRVSATPFCFVTGSGHQYFLDTVRQLMRGASADRIRSALFEPWTYADKGLSLRWDPKEAARYALMDVDPGPEGAFTVWMANLLAYRALTLFPSAPGGNGLQTTGWRRSGNPSFTWPIWKAPADPDTIRSLMLLAQLGDKNHSELRARGIMAIFRAQRLKVGSGTNYKINFSPARGV